MHTTRKQLRPYPPLAGVAFGGRRPFGSAGAVGRGWTTCGQGAWAAGVDAGSPHESRVGAMRLRTTASADVSAGFTRGYQSDGATRLDFWAVSGAEGKPSDRTKVEVRLCTNAHAFAQNWPAATTAAGRENIGSSHNYPSRTAGARFRISAALRPE